MRFPQHTLGAYASQSGVHFSAFSRHASSLFVCLFEGEREVDRILMTRASETIHEIFVPGVKTGQCYGLRADGSYDLGQGHCFDLSKLLIDPYAVKIDRRANWRQELCEFGSETGHLVPKCIVAEIPPSGTRLSPGNPSFIYEIPVRAMTMQHPEVPMELRGTVAALGCQPVLDHLKNLGCDAVELMPIATWIDERHLTLQGLSNAWGYNPVSFFCPDPRIAPGGIEEVRQTVDAFHRCGIKVILDVVFNHTGESDFSGPTLSLRGLDNLSYYRMSEGKLVNETGCGNTLALDQSPAIQLVISAMRHWVKTTGIDGFRYDLAPVMGRTEKGFSPASPLLESIMHDPDLAALTHIVEPWDVGWDGYQLGNFPQTWLEWNDRYRDDVRRFWRGDDLSAGSLATRLAGSSDFFDKQGRTPSASINFVAAHDGFTLLDVASFGGKRNLGNGEANRDGSDHEVCWISAEPMSSVRAMLATLFLSRGTLMLTAGDEFGRTQSGNNNAYAQDNPVTWRDWEKVDRDLWNFVAALSRFRRDFADYFDPTFLTGLPLEPTTIPDALWFGEDGRTLGEHDWISRSLQSIGLAVASRQRTGRIGVVFSNIGAALNFTLPTALMGYVWQVPEGFPTTKYVAVFREVRETETVDPEVVG